MSRFLMNPFFQYLLFNVTILLFYIMSLSDLYSPNAFFVVYFISILFFFFVLSLRYYKIHIGLLQKEKINQYISIDSGKIFNCIIYITFFIGALASIYQLYHFGATIFQENKVSRIEGSHYVDYLVNLLQISLCLSYIAIKSKLKKYNYIYFFIILVSFLLLSVKLNRGAFTFFLLVYIYISYVFSYKKNKQKKWFFKMACAVIIFGILFGAIGNMRLNYVLENIYHMSINDLYGMSNIYPSAFVWIYIYFTSPLENISRMIMEQSVWEYHWGLNLVYPFVAPLAKEIFSDRGSLYPPLAPIAGLNVSSYIQEALVDFGMIGPYIYMAVLCLVYMIAIFRLKNIYGFLCYISAINIGFWMIFTNSFAVGPNMINYLFFLMMSFISSAKSRRRKEGD